MVSCMLTESGITVGSVARLETVNGLTAEGTVLSFDKDFKFLVLDTKKSAAEPLIRIFNVQHLKFIKRLSSKEEDDRAHALKRNEQFASNTGPTCKSTAERFERMMREVKPNLMPGGVSMRGQQAFLQLKRTIGDTCWSGDSIRVLGSVIIAAPYGVENVGKDGAATGFDDARVATTISQVKKILAKPLTDFNTRPPIDFTTVIATN